MTYILSVAVSNSSQSEAATTSGHAVCIGPGVGKQVITLYSAQVYRPRVAANCIQLVSYYLHSYT